MEKEKELKKRLMDLIFEYIDGGMSTSQIIGILEVVKLGLHTSHSMTKILTMKKELEK